MTRPKPTSILRDERNDFATPSRAELLALKARALATVEALTAASLSRDLYDAERAELLADLRTIRQVSKEQAQRRGVLRPKDGRQ